MDKQQQGKKESWNWRQINNIECENAEKNEKGKMKKINNTPFEMLNETHTHTHIVT